jgi:Xaa-Pro aminopeptidase
MGDVFEARMARTRAAMVDAGVDVLGLSVGADLPWLCGYEAMPLERLTMLVVPAEGDAELVVPALEASRVTERPSIFGLRPWGETEDPCALVAERIPDGSTAVISNQTWSQFLLRLQDLVPSASFGPASAIVGPLRACKDAAEIESLATASAAVDRIAKRLQNGEIALIGRRESDVATEMAQQIRDEGHQRVNFTIVASGPNAASPHHDAGDRVIRPDEVVLCDWGGTMYDEHGVGYCSDITRCVYTGEVPDEFGALYDVLFTAQASGVAAAQVGSTCASVDGVTRKVITDGGYGEYFIHRTGHGIGVEAHEDPYIVEGNETPLAAGHAFSIEPGIYVPGRFGARLEDIVVATPNGPRTLNAAERSLVSVTA